MFGVALALGLLAMPLPTDAQQGGKPFKIGALYVPTAGKALNITGGLGELGYVEGRDYVFEYR